MPAQLDAAPPRPLTSREISKLLCAILHGVYTVDPTASADFDPLLATSAAIAEIDLNDVSRLMAQLDELAKSTTMPKAKALWHAAITATVGGLTHWCALADIQTAIAWVREHAVQMYPVPVAPN